MIPPNNLSAVSHRWTVFCRCRWHRWTVYRRYSFANISANFRKNSKRPQWNTWGPGGHWFMKKTWSRKSKISCQTPFKGKPSQIKFTAMNYCFMFLPFLVVCEKGIRHPNFLRKISGECKNLIKSFKKYEEYIENDLNELKNQPFILFSHTKSCYEGSQTNS
jgi:hypothetical protein